VKKIDTSNVRIPGTNLQGGRAIAVGVLVLYILLFIAVNDRKLNVDFVFFSVHSNELLGLVVICGLGFAAGFIARDWLRPKQVDPQPRVIEAAPTPSAAQAEEAPRELPGD